MAVGPGKSLQPGPRNPHQWSEQKPPCWRATFEGPFHHRFQDPYQLQTYLASPAEAQVSKATTGGHRRDQVGITLPADLMVFSTLLLSSPSMKKMSKLTWDHPQISGGHILGYRENVQETIVFYVFFSIMCGGAP